MKNRWFALLMAVGLVASLAGTASAAGMVEVVADAADSTWPGGFLHGDCLYRNATGTETLDVTWWATLTFSDGSTSPAGGPESTVLAPGDALLNSIGAVVPETAPAGQALFTCHSDAVVIEGTNPGATSRDAASDAFRVRKTSIRPR